MMSLRNLEQASTTANFINACRRLLDEQKISVVNMGQEEVLESGLAPVIQSTDSYPVHRDICTPGMAANHPDVAFELAFNAAMQGGFFEMRDGEINQWEVYGSGSAALNALIRELREDGKLLGIHLNTTEFFEQEKYFESAFEGVPHAQQRFIICSQFACQNRRRQFDKFISGSQVAFTKWNFSMYSVNRLVNLYPAAFAGDPFRKKAILALMMLASSLKAEGKVVEYDLPIPSDYQIPRILAWKGLISLAHKPEQIAELNSGKLINVSSRLAINLRAAAVVACHDLGKITRRSADIVDAALFSNFRRDPDFIVNALPPLRCDSLWF